VTVYDFKQQLAYGEAQERILDAFFAHWFAITEATRAEQRIGIDRHFTARNPDYAAPFTVEYKTDTYAHRTRCAFVETVSVAGKKQGWAYTSQAKYLIYFAPVPEGMPVPETIVVVRFTRLREHLPAWQVTHPTKSAQNADYNSSGVIVPLALLEAIAHAQFIDGEAV
jgi:hypothetical protein